MSWEFFPCEIVLLCRVEGEAEFQALKARTDGLVKDIEVGKSGLFEASYTDSERKPGCYSGGEIELVKVADLCPEIDGTLPALTEGKVSLPMETKDRVRIFKKGRSSPRHPVAEIYPRRFGSRQERAVAPVAAQRS